MPKLKRKKMYDRHHVTMLKVMVRKDVRNFESAVNKAEAGTLIKRTSILVGRFKK